MPDSEKDRLAAEVAERYSAFEEALFRDKRRYPLPEFKSFWEAGRRYAELTKSDALIHRKVVEVVHGLTDMVVGGGSGFRRMSHGTPSDWGAWFSVDTILTSRETSHRGYRLCWSAICTFRNSRALTYAAWASHLVKGQLSGSTIRQQSAEQIQMALPPGALKRESREVPNLHGASN